MDCFKPVRLKTGLLVPCGKCLNCRVQKRREWSLRAYNELSEHEKACFLTLTYDKKSIPFCASLCKQDLVNFIKRLRKDLSMQGRKIRYFACGEYGDENSRPHYHLIVFGLGLDTADKRLVVDNWSFCDWSNSDIVKGSFGIAEPKSIQYVAKYIHKKCSGDLAVSEYDEKNREPVFKLQSQGLGKGYVDKNYKQIYQQLCIKMNSYKMSLPRYYINRLDIDCDELKEVSEKKLLQEYKKVIKKDLSDSYVNCKRNVSKWKNLKKKDISYDVDNCLQAQLSSDDRSILREERKRKRLQIDKNLRARIDLKKGKF